MPTTGEPSAPSCDGQDGDAPVIPAPVDDVTLRRRWAKDFDKEVKTLDCVQAARTLELETIVNISDQLL